MNSLTETADVELSTSNSIQQTAAQISSFINITNNGQNLLEDQNDFENLVAQPNRGLKRPFQSDDDDEYISPEETERRAAAFAKYRRQEEKRRRKAEAELNQINAIRAASGRPPSRSAARASDSNRRANDEAGRVYDKKLLDDMGTSIGYDYVTKAGTSRKV